MAVAFQHRVNCGRRTPPPQPPSDRQSRGSGWRGVDGPERQRLVAGPAIVGRDVPAGLPPLPEGRGMGSRLAAARRTVWPIWPMSRGQPFGPRAIRAGRRPPWAVPVAGSSLVPSPGSRAQPKQDFEPTMPYPDRPPIPWTGPRPSPQASGVIPACRHWSSTDWCRNDPCFRRTDVLVALAACCPTACRPGRPRPGRTASSAGA